MDEAVIPCLHLMNRDSTLPQEDRDAMEAIRSHWCCCLGQDMDRKFRLYISLYYSYSCIHAVSYDELEVLITAAQKEINI